MNESSFGGCIKNPENVDHILQIPVYDEGLWASGGLLVQCVWIIQRTSNSLRLSKHLKTIRNLLAKRWHLHHVSCKILTEPPWSNRGQKARYPNLPKDWPLVRWLRNRCLFKVITQSTHAKS